MNEYRHNTYEEEKPIPMMQNPDSDETKQFRVGARWLGLVLVVCAGGCSGYWIHNDRCLVEKERLTAEQKRYEVELEMWKHVPRWSDPDGGR